MQNTTLEYFMTVAKTCEKVLRCQSMKVKHVFNKNVKVANFSFLNKKSHITKQV